MANASRSVNWNKLSFYIPDFSRCCVGVEEQQHSTSATKKDVPTFNFRMHFETEHRSVKVSGRIQVTAIQRGFQNG